LSVIVRQIKSVATSFIGQFNRRLKTLTGIVFNETNKREIVKQSLKNTAPIFLPCLVPFKVTPAEKRIPKTTTRVETTTAPSEATTVKQQPNDRKEHLKRPSAGSLLLKGNAPSAHLWQSQPRRQATTAPVYPQLRAAALTRMMVYAYIKANYSGAEQDKRCLLLPMPSSACSQAVRVKNIDELLLSLSVRVLLRKRVAKVSIFVCSAPE